MTLRLIPARVGANFFSLVSPLHTSTQAPSRIKRSHTHKPFFLIKKTAKHPDEPITSENQSFVQKMIRQTYAEDSLGTYVTIDSENGSLLRPELQPWPRHSWDEYGEKTKRIGLLARKIGVVPMWFSNGKRVATTMLQVEKNVYKYSNFFEIMLAFW